MKESVWPATVPADPSDCAPVYCATSVDPATVNPPADRDEQEDQREGETDGGQRVGRVATEPEGVREVVRHL
jgi:hypothetical protein